MVIKYKLLKEYIPKGYGKGQILSEKDKEMGGIKLLYEVEEINISTNKSTKYKKVFLRPFKEYWEIDKESCRNKDEWGTDLVTTCNIWLDIINDYENILDEPYVNYIKVTNTELLGMLSRRVPNFSISFSMNKKINTTINTPITDIKQSITNKFLKKIRNIRISYLLISTNLKSKLKSHDKN